MANPSQENVVSPYPTHRFEIVLNVAKPPADLTNPLCNASFAECSGLEMSMAPKSYHQGGDNQRQFHRPGKVTYGRLTLRRGMTDTLHLWNWFALASKPGRNSKADGEISLWDASGEARLTYILEGCLPVKVTGPSFNAKTPAIAIEELHVIYETLTLRAAGQSGAGLGISAGISVSAGVSVSGGPGLTAGVSASASASANLSIG